MVTDSDEYSYIQGKEAPNATIRDQVAMVQSSMKGKETEGNTGFVYCTTRLRALVDFGW